MRMASIAAGRPRPGIAYNVSVPSYRPVTTPGPEGPQGFPAPRLTSLLRTPYYRPR